MARQHCMLGWGVVLALLGTAIVIIGIVVTPREFPTLFKDHLDDYLIVDSAHAQQYKAWESQNDFDNPYYLAVTMFNLTNMNDVLQGNTPIFTQVGPYMYRRYRKSTNVSFPDNGEFVQYSEFVDYYFDADASNGLSDTDLITNINPVYIGGLMQSVIPDSALGAPAEQNLVLAVTGGMIKSLTDYLTGPFIPLYTALTFPGYFTKVMNTNIAALNATYNQPQQAYDMFIDAWRNSTTAPTLGNWTGVLLSQGLSVPANISSSSAQLLLNQNFTYSLLDTSYEAAWYWDQSAQNATIAQTLTTTFQITIAQLSLIRNWRNTVFAPTWMYPDIISTYNLETISDLGWIQWATQDPLGGSIAIFPDIANIGIYGQIELDNTDTTWQQWRSIMNPSTGLENITVFQDFFKAYSANMTGDFSQWGLNVTTAADFVTGYIFNLANSQGMPAILANMGPTGGLFITRTVSQWALNCDDYLLNLLRETPPLCSFRYNNSAPPQNTIYSGKSDMNMINMYYEFQGQKQLFEWAAPINVTGHTELGQFIPGHTDRTPYPVFQQDTFRTIYLNYSTNVIVKGIAADRYILDFKKTFGASDLYYQPFVGLANMTAFHSGSPIFLSLWDMLNVENATNMVSGLAPTNEFNDSTVIDIEVTTGIAIQSRKRMQVNVYVPANSTAWFGGQSPFSNDKLTTGIFYPIAKIGEYATISDSKAAELKSKLGLPPKVNHVAFYVGVTAGPTLIVLAVFLFFLTCRRSSEERDPLLVVNHPHNNHLH